MNTAKNGNQQLTTNRKRNIKKNNTHKYQPQLKQLHREKKSSVMETKKQKLVNNNNIYNLNTRFYKIKKNNNDIFIFESIDDFVARVYIVGLECRCGEKGLTRHTKRPIEMKTKIQNTLL